MADNLGERCGFTGPFGRKCENKAYNPVKILTSPVVTPDGRYHWEIDKIEYLCSEHAREELVRGNTTATKVSYEELEDLLHDYNMNINVSNRKPEAQEEKLKNQ